MRGGKTFTAGQRRAGDPDQGTREGGWGATGEAGTEVWGGVEATGFLRTDMVLQTTEDAAKTGESVASRRLRTPCSRPHTHAACFRFRGGGPGRPGARGYFEEYAGQEEGFDGHEDMGRGWDNGGRLGPHRAGGPPRGETGLLRPPRPV